MNDSFRELQVTSEQEAIRYKKLNAKGEEVFIDEEHVLPAVQFKEVEPTVVKMSAAAVEALEHTFVQATYLDRQYGKFIDHVGFIFIDTNNCWMANILLYEWLIYCCMNV